MSSIALLFKGLAISVKGVVSGGQETNRDLDESLSYFVALPLFIVPVSVNYRKSFLRNAKQCFVYWSTTKIA